MPPERVLRFLLIMWPPFEACRRPRVYHLGVDVFVGTVDLPDVVATSGVGQAIRPPLIGVNRPHRAGEEQAPERSATWRPRWTTHRSTASTATPATATFTAPGVGAALQRSDTDEDESAPKAWIREASPTQNDHRHHKAGRTSVQAGRRNFSANGSQSRGCRCSWCARTAVWEVRLCPEVSDASSLRGGRSNRASHQSRPRRLTPPRADASRICPRRKQVRRRPGRPATPRPSRQPTPTQVSGLAATQLRAWSCETAAKRRYSP